jgi:hypothetical protein
MSKGFGREEECVTDGIVVVARTSIALSWRSEVSRTVRGNSQARMRGKGFFQVVTTSSTPSIPPPCLKLRLLEQDVWTRSFGTLEEISGNWLGHHFRVSLELCHTLEFLSDGVAGGEMICR